VSPSDLAVEPVLFPLRPGRGTIALHATGFRHPRSRRTPLEHFTAYGDVAHLALGRRTLRIGTRQGVFAIGRDAFTTAGGAEAFARALEARIAAEPNGAVQLAQMAEVEELARHPASQRVTVLLVLACVGAFALQAWLGPGVHHAGFFSAPLATRGEPWRLVTSNLLHGGPPHLAINALCLLVFGGLVERTLGSARTVLIAGLAALGSTIAGLYAGYEAMVGASGIVAGFVGALLWLEFRLPERVPAQWRIPRRLFLGVLLFEALLEFFAPGFAPEVAVAAHAGGFLAGGLATALVAGPSLRREALRPAALVAVALVLAVAGASIASAARLLFGSSAWESHAERLLNLDTAPVLILNDAAWLIATGATPTHRALEEARELAQRAVTETGRQDPNLLDTLAEVQFQTGDGKAAVETIDEAIALAPGIPYFEEQRRRFTGERDRNDRPAPPDAPVFGPELEDEPGPEIPNPHRGFEEDPGVAI
jgi:membrane associated rhomboid family serine protease